MAHDTRKQITRTLWGVFLGIIVIYALFQMRDIIFGAQLSVTSITDGAVVTDQLLTIEGQMKHAASVTIDGNAIATDQNGHFSEQLLLSPGYNLVTIDARDRFGKLIEKTYRVLYNEQALGDVPSM